MTTENKPPDEKGNEKSIPEPCSRNGFAQRYRPAARTGEIATNQQEEPPV